MKPFLIPTVSELLSHSVYFTHLVGWRWASPREAKDTRLLGKVSGGVSWERARGGAWDEWRRARRGDGWFGKWWLKERGDGDLGRGEKNTFLLNYYSISRLGTQRKRITRPRKKARYENRTEAARLDWIPDYLSQKPNYDTLLPAVTASTNHLCPVPFSLCLSLRLFAPACLIVPLSLEASGFLYLSQVTSRSRSDPSSTKKRTIKPSVMLS